MLLCKFANYPRQYHIHVHHQINQIHDSLLQIYTSNIHSGTSLKRQFQKAVLNARWSLTGFFKTATKMAKIAIF